MHFLPVLLAAFFLNKAALKLGYHESTSWWIGFSAFLILGFFARLIGAAGNKYVPDSDCHPVLKEHIQAQQRFSGAASCSMVAYLAAVLSLLSVLVLWLLSFMVVDPVAPKPSPTPRPVTKSDKILDDLSSIDEKQAHQILLFAAAYDEYYQIAVRNKIQPFSPEQAVAYVRQSQSTDSKVPPEDLESILKGRADGLWAGSSGRSWGKIQLQNAFGNIGRDGDMKEYWNFLDLWPNGEHHYRGSMFGRPDLPQVSHPTSWPNPIPAQTPSTTSGR